MKVAIAAALSPPPSANGGESTCEARKATFTANPLTGPSRVRPPSLLATASMLLSVIRGSVPPPLPASQPRQRERGAAVTAPAGGAVLPLFAALGAGACASLGFAPHDLGWLTPLAHAWFAHRITAATSHRQAVLEAACYGLALYGMGLSWLWVGVASHPQPLLASLPVAGLVLYLASYPTVIALLVRFSGVPRWIQLTVLLPALWVLGEWLRHLGDLAFPWLTLGYTQIPEGMFASWAPVVGVLGISALLTVVGGCLALLPGGDRLRRTQVLLFLALLFAFTAVLQRVTWTQPAGGPIAVSLLQGNVPQPEKFSPHAVARALDIYTALSEKARGRVVVMPETALPVFAHQISGFLDHFDQLARKQGTDLIVSHFRTADAGPPHYHSTVTMVGVSGVQRYDKRDLLPFGEFVPGPGPVRAVYERLNPIPLLDTMPGDSRQDMPIVAGLRTSLRLCFEDVFGARRRWEPAQAGFLITLANDSWHSARGQIHQHLQIGEARALEAGKPLLRVGNTGWTAIIDHRGRPQKTLPIETTGLLEGTIEPRSGTTPYLVLGDAPVLAFSVLAACAAILARKDVSAQEQG